MQINEVHVMEENINAILSSVSESVRNNVAMCIELFSHIRWKKILVTIPMIPKPSQRPRLCGYRVYVPGASKNAAFFEKNVLPTMNGLFISTPCKIKLDIYAPIPPSFTNTQKCLADMKILRPWAHTGDIDNYAKSALDMIQPNEKRGHTGILYDDSLVIDLQTSKYYSSSPRYELVITYMDKIPDKLMSSLRLKNIQH